MADPERSRVSRIVFSVAVFLSFVRGVLWITLHRFLLPAAAAAHGSDPASRKLLVAVSWMVLLILLLSLFTLFVVLFRPGRMFLPRKSSPRTRTPYVDAWAEAGRRLGQKKGEG